MKTITQTLSEKLEAGENPDIVGDLIKHARMMEDCIGAADAAITDLHDEMWRTIEMNTDREQAMFVEFCRGITEKLGEISKLLEKEDEP